MLVKMPVYYLAPDQHIEKVQDSVGAINHERGEDIAEEENEGVDDDEAVLFDLG